jgi:carboxylesterase type B
MKHYWANFAARGIPSSAGDPRWPSFNRDSQQMLSLVSLRPQLQSDFTSDHHCGFWVQLG